MGIERKGKPQALHPSPSIRASSPRLSIPHPLGQSPGPRHLGISQATLRKWNFYFYKYRDHPLKGS